MFQASAPTPRVPSSFANYQITWQFFGRPPIWLIISFPYIPVKRGPGPILNRFYQPMFHRIVVNVIHMPVEIQLIPDGMFPETSLPYRSFSLFDMRRVPFFSRPNVQQICFCKQPFNFFPSNREIAIIFRELPNTMQMIRQQTNGLSSKGESLLRILPNSPKDISFYFPSQYSFTMIGDDCEEECSTL